MVHAPPRLDSAVPVRINLYSDTQSRPTAAMRAAMAEAEVGDEQSGDDPTINRLCDRVAELLGKDRAMFLPSGVMCNQVAILTHCRPGDAVLAHRTAHILHSEGGAPAALAGVQIMPLDGGRGQFDADALRDAIRPASRYAMPQTLLSVEQTANLGGGTVWPLHRLRAVAELAHEAGLATHMDGARLMNAVVAAGVPARDMAEGYDSVWLDFTKGLGAPLGAVLAGDAGFVDAAWRWKQRLGGALRQGGICAAACLHALDHHVARLAQDHENAALLAALLADAPTLSVPPPETNLVYVDTAATGIPAAALAERLREVGILLSVMGPDTLRAGVHLDVNRAQVAEAAAAIRAVVA